MRLADTPGQRLVCNLCQHHLSEDDQQATVPCHVRAYAGEQFDLWRCSKCRTIHCLDYVDLAHYYAQYPVFRSRLTGPVRLVYHNLYRRFKSVGFTKQHTLLDYGCGNGNFLAYLRRRQKHDRCWGYDPHAKNDGLANAKVLNEGPFDFILLQDVIEHVEEPAELLKELNEHLHPGGHIHIGTPNAERIRLDKPLAYLNELHAPYHLHILTRNGLEHLGRRQGWTPVKTWNRPYFDVPWFGLNYKAAKTYQKLEDGMIDVLVEPVDGRKLAKSPRFWLNALLGYWLSTRPHMAIMFRKDT